MGVLSSHVFKVVFSKTDLIPVYANFHVCTYPSLYVTISNQKLRQLRYEDCCFKKVMKI